MRMLIAPVLASTAMALIAVAGGLELTPVWVLAASAAYGVVFLGIEFLRFPADFAFYVAAMRRVGSADVASPPDTPAGADSHRARELRPRV